MNCSVFALFKVGPGPSSSHTIGPMNAALEFVRRIGSLPGETLGEASGVKVQLFGSLADTGVGHGTVQALLAGLSGLSPESCGNLRKLPERVEVRADGFTCHADASCVEFKLGPHGYPYQNTMLFKLVDPSGSSLLELEAYSVGGGFVKYKDEAEAMPPARPWPFKDMRELRWLCAENGLSIASIVAGNELAAYKMSRLELDARLDFILDSMDAAVERGLSAEGILSGPLRLERKAKSVLSNVSNLAEGERLMASLDAYAFAASEENAAGGVVVTAPTSGASGVLTAVARALTCHADIGRAALREGLLAAAAIGGIAKANASISGAEVGCQGEVGVASAMAAAMIAQARGASPAVVENAAETALEHHLGLTCDPVGGYVQIPCIERNAIAAVHAWNAYLVVSSLAPGAHRVSFDEVVEAMRQTGRDMSLKYKESSRGGLAVCAGRC
jgi:L-serine dehydratase